MPTALESMFREFHEEVPVTRRVLERVPADKLSWKPHPMSMPLGHLAKHVAKMPGFFAKVVQAAELDMAKVSVLPPECPTNPSEILVALDQSILEFEECLERMTEQQSLQIWSLKMGEKVFL